jgi:hypothetical protein
MKEINTGKLFNWKDTVEQLTQLPGEPAFDKSAAWDKLQQRLHKKTVAKKIIWYRLPAACLLVGFLAAAILVIKQEPNTAAVVSQRKQIMEAVQQPSIIQNENKNSVITGLLTNTNTTKPIVEKKDKKEITATASVTDIATVELRNLNKEELPLSEIKIVQPLMTDTAASFTSIASANKKKLKVVHINELGLPLERETSVAQNHQLLFLQGSYLNNRNLVGNLHTESYSNTAIFSIKLSSPK